MTSFPNSRLPTRRGGRLMTLGSAGSAASIMPMVTAVTRLTYRTWDGARSENPTARSGVSTREQQRGSTDLDGCQGGALEADDVRKEDGESLGEVDGEVEDEQLAQVVPHTATLLDGRYDRGKVVIWSIRKGMMDEASMNFPVACSEHQSTVLQ